jgi:acyl-CoA synthetase (AMP-forming)/AMP-acid ligase II
VIGRLEPEILKLTTILCSLLYHKTAFKQLYDKVCKTAYLLCNEPKYAFQARTKKEETQDEKHPFTVGLLAPSCADFLITLFALFRLGWSVLLIA